MLPGMLYPIIGLSTLLTSTSDLFKLLYHEYTIRRLFWTLRLLLFLHYVL
jgi:hypothetical protein